MSTEPCEGSRDGDGGQGLGRARWKREREENVDRITAGAAAGTLWECMGLSECLAGRKLDPGLDHHPAAGLLRIYLEWTSIPASHPGVPTSRC